MRNSDSRPWQLADAFWFCRSAIGGSPADDVVGGPSVPNYYRPAQFCTDRKLGGCFGEVGQAGGWQTAFSVNPNGSIHPDTHWKVEQRLRPGQRWTAEGVAYLWIFAARQAADWHTAADRQQQAAGLLTAENKP